MQTRRLSLIALTMLLAVGISCGESGPTEPDPPPNNPGTPPPTTPPPTTPTPPPPPPVVTRAVSAPFTVMDTIARDGTVHIFSIPWTALATYRISLQATSGQEADTIIVRGYKSSGGPPILLLESVGTQSEWHEFTTEVPRNDQPDLGITLRLDVRGKSQTQGGPYRIAYRARDSIPEVLDSTFVLGDTLVGERIEDVRDVDRFVFDVENGSEWVQFARIDTTIVGGRFGVGILSASGVPLGAVEIQAPATLEEHGFRFVANGTGPYVLRAAPVAGIFWQGPYALWAYRVNRAPEHAPTGFAAGDTLSDAIDAVGDIDEYLFLGQAGDEISFHLAVQDFVPSGVRVQVFDGTTLLRELTSGGLDVTLNGRTTSSWIVPRTDSYRVRVSGNLTGRREQMVSPYRVEAYRINRAPETIPASGYAINSTIVGEWIDRPRDVDEFELTLTEGDTFGAIFTRIRTRSSDRMRLTIVRPDGTQMLALDDETGGHPVPLVDSVGIGFLFAPMTGTYTVRVAGSMVDPATYAIRFYPISMTPESIPSTLASGAWVTGESIDVIGDVDRFTFAALADVVYTFVLEDLMPNPHGNHLRMQLDPVGAYAWGDGRALAHLSWPVPTGLTLTVESLSGLTAPYRLRIFELNTAPESAAAAIAIGDTVGTESLDHPGDIDEFTFSAVAGDLLRVALVRLSGEESDRLHFRVRSVATREVVASGTSPLELNFTIPETGPYLVEIIVPSSGPTMAHTGPYRLALTRQP